MVCGVMGQVVGQVAHQETRGERRHPLRRLESYTQDQVENPDEDQRQRDADREGHDQAGLVLRLGVMDAVEQEKDTFLARAGRFVMEQETVQGVLGQGP